MAARRAAELDPLSPTMATQLVMTLAYAGQLDEARKELGRAERLWAGTGALRDAQWAFHLRYGDPALAKKYARAGEYGLDLYLAVRSDPSPANAKRLADYIRQFAEEPGVGAFGWAIQAFGEINQIEDVLFWIGRTPTDPIAESAYLFFRPALAGLRRDPRFMAVAKRIKLIDYWRSSGKWPDFCSAPDLPYDCKAEAAKYA